MNRRFLARLAVVPLVAGAGLVGPAAPAALAAPAAPAASTAEVYVSSLHCRPGGDGSMAAPYCTISAAAAVAQPGQTVLVQPGSYPEAVTFTRSGTEDAPITFRAVNGPVGHVMVGDATSGAVTGPVLTLAGVHDVEVEGFRLVSVADQSALVIDGSHRVTVDAINASGIRAPATVRVTGASGDVTVSRSYLTNAPASNPAITIDPGVTGAVIVGNQLPFAGVRITDAPGTAVTNNTVLTNCVPGVEVLGASTGVSIENNIVRTHRFRATCVTPANATAISVSASSVPGTIVDYNLIDPISGGTLYAWAGTGYQDLPSFQQATGQGGHDIVGDPLIGALKGVALRYYLELDPASPAVDSANAAARGVARTDMLGNPHSDNSAVANTGTGIGYHDRGAIEVQGGVNGGQVGLQRKRGDDPFAVTAVAAKMYAWPVDGVGGSIAYQFTGDRFWRVTDARMLDHSFRRAGEVCVSIRTSFTGFRAAPEYSYFHCTTVGARYNPLAPTRVLDTRAAIGTASTTPVAPYAEVTLPIPSINGVPAADISAVVLNVTVTRPTAPGFIRVSSADTVTDSSSVNFVANETVPNLVTVGLGNGIIRLVNRSAGTVHLVADLQGFYARQGSGFAPLTPVRVLDTRTGAATPLAAHGDRRLDLSGRLPADATAAILNVTVTRPTAYGVLTVYPDGSPAPNASNLNFAPGQTIPNLVVVPVVAGKVMIRNASPGTTHVVADLAGYFGSAASGADQVYVPYGPTRVADTRNETGWIKYSSGAIGPNYRALLEVPSHNGCDGGCPRPTAVVLNLTVTAPTAAGVLSAYPHGQGTLTVSNVNFVARETASNLAVVKLPDGSGPIAVVNRSSGYTHVIADEFGYFIAPA